jgi:methylglutaconyl-CoA hydratase
MPEPLVIRQIKGPVALLTLNRPDKRNALSRALLSELSGAIDELAGEQDIRAIVLTGAGPSFCTGMDLNEAAATDETPGAPSAADLILREFAGLLDRLHGSPKPTIAAVHGDVLAGGAGLMSACDLAVATPTARFGYPEVRRGLVAAIVMHDLSRQIGDRRARQLLLSGTTITSTIACSWGLVNLVAPEEQLLEEAIGLAASLAECAPEALAMTKRLLDEAYGRPSDLGRAAEMSARIRRSEEAREGIRAFVEKRPPAWAMVKAGSGE